MNIIMKLTFRHLLSNGKRTVVTILGIVASTALITAILVGIVSFFRFLGDVSVVADGNWHVIFEDITPAQVEMLKSDERIAVAGCVDADAVISGFRLLAEWDVSESSLSSESVGKRFDADAGGEVMSGEAAMPAEVPARFRIGNVYHGDHENLEQMVSCEYEGRLPEHADEIAVEESLLKENGLSIAVGDGLTFEQGYRYMYEIDGDIIYLGGAWRSAELFEATSTETCVVTAILHGNSATGSYKILRGMDDHVLPDEVNVYVSLKNCDHTAAKQIRAIAEEYGFTKYDLNREYLVSVFAIGGIGDGVLSLFKTMGIALLIVMIASVILIYNAFAMSLAERMRYLGMLASVGATKKQKRSSIFQEGFLLGLVGIPVGIGVGIVGSYFTLRILGGKILEADMLRGISGMQGGIPTRVPVWVILLIVLLAGLTIFISAAIPAVKASRIMPVDALRQSGEIRLKAWRLKVFPLAKYLFGYEGELACKNLKRNGRKGMVITFSIAVSVVMFLSILYFCDSFQKANSYEIELPFQVFAQASLAERDRLRADLEAIDGVEKVYPAEMISFEYGKEEEAADSPDPAILNPDFLTKDYAGLFEREKTIWLILVEDSEFWKLLEDNGLSVERYDGETLRGVLLNNYNHVNTKKKVFNEGILGQSLYYAESDEFTGNPDEAPAVHPPAVEIGDFVAWDKDNYIFRLSPKNSISVYVPVSRYYEKMAEIADIDALTCTYGVECRDHEAVAGKVFDLLEYDGYHNYMCSDLAQSLQIMMTVLLLLKTVMYGFTGLLSLIAIANIVNTISTGILLRRKEFAMFQSVGMTEGGLRKMIFLETFLYGFRALAWGIPISLLLSVVMYRTLGVASLAFEVNIWMYLLVVAAVFGIVGISMLLGTSKVKQDSIIEVLKEDIT